MENCTQACAACENNHISTRPEKVTKNIQTRLNRIEGQVKGIKSMVERGTYCDDILTQISAAQSAMSAVAKILLESHVRSCVAQKLKAGDTAVVEELITTIGRLV